MSRVVLYLVLLILVARALSRLWSGIVEGLGGQTRRRDVAPRRVQMARDPVCGTFVVPDHALMLTVRGEHVFFCSLACRDKFRADRAAGRTA